MISCFVHIAMFIYGDLPWHLRECNDTLILCFPAREIFGAFVIPLQHSGI